jgi:asparagine synthase (glutamine-hydrolysing)
MCGIAGFLQNHPSPPCEELLFEMIGRLRHRGPDESGAYFDERIALGHARLSIIGVEGGAQPLANEDGSLWIVYAGEAFNYPELREELLSRGHRFSTQTDTEVVLHLYEEFGPAALEKINGQFSLAIWDSRREELFLARDRVGIRPLYYTRSRERFLFASEIKALFADPEVHRELDPEALAQVFTFWTTLPSRTAFRHVQELPPGHFMIVKVGETEKRAWWRIPSFGAEDRWEGTFDEAREELSSLLTDAVRVRLRADVPVGSYLSGGLDSSIVTALAADQVPGRLHTFAMGFEEAAFDETTHQNRMVKHLHTDHSRLVISNREIGNHFAETIRHCERPIVRTAPIPLLLLSRLVRNSGFKVALTGEGADEVFGGYNIFKEAKIRAFWARDPDSRCRPLLLQRLYPYIFQNSPRGRLFLQHFFAVHPQDRNDPFLSHRIRWKSGGRNVNFLSDEVRSTLHEDPFSALHDLLPAGFSRRGGFERAQWLEMSIFLSDYLLSSQGDRVAMANSVELRHPFLDVRVIEFAARLPAHWKMRGLREKHILKESFRHRLPAPISDRPKQPFRAPIREVFFAENGESLLANLLSDDALRESALFHPGRVAQLIRKITEPGAPPNEGRNMAIAAIASAQILHHLFIRNSLSTGRLEEPGRVIRRYRGRQHDDTTAVPAQPGCRNHVRLMSSGEMHG